MDDFVAVALIGNWRNFQFIYCWQFCLAFFNNMQKLFGTQVKNFDRISFCLHFKIKNRPSRKIYIENLIAYEYFGRKFVLRKLLKSIPSFILNRLCITAPHILNSFRIFNPFWFSFAASIPIQWLTCTHTYQLLCAMDPIL